MISSYFHNSWSKTSGIHGRAVVWIPWLIFRDSVFIILWLKKMSDSEEKWKLISAVFKTHIPLLSGKFVILLRLWAPKVRHCHIPLVTLSFLSFFFPFFSTFLSFSLLLYLFFFVFFFRAKSSYSLTTHTSHSHADPRRPKLRDHQRQSSITRRKAPPCAHSPHRCYRTRSSIWSEHRNRHPQQRRISVGNNWKRFDLEAYSSI